MTAFIAFVLLTVGVATDAFTENERLYLTMLIQERDSWAKELQRKIGLCENELKRNELKSRKQRSAKSGYAEPVRIPLGDGRWVDLDDKVSRKDIERVIKYLKEKLELVENGTTIPEDRFWDPRIFSKFGRLGGSIRVVQVIGPSDMIVDRGGDQDRTLWIEGFSTKNYADDQTIGFGDQLFLAVGTKSYTNTLGARATTRLLRPFVIDREKVIAEFRVQSKGGAPSVSNIHPTSERKATDVGSPTDSDAVERKRIPTASGQLTEDEQRYLTAIIEERDARVDELRKAIAQVNLEPTTVASPKKKHGARTTKSERVRAADQPKYVHVGGSEFVTPLKSVEAELADLESGKTVIEPHVSREGLSKVGSVMQIHRLKVVQVFGPSDMLATGPLTDQISWLNGFPTKDMADGQVFSLNELIVINGTKRYETVTGTSRTVFVWRPLVIDREKVLAQYRARSKPAPEATVPAKALPKLKPDAASADPDAAARKRFAGVLTNARSLIKVGLRDAAEKNLRRIINEVPGTAIAREAEKELAQLQNNR